MQRRKVCTSQCIRNILAHCGQWKHGLTLVMPMTSIALCYVSIITGMASGMVLANIAGLSLVVLNLYQMVTLHHTHSVSVDTMTARQMKIGLSLHTVRSIRLTKAVSLGITRVEINLNGCKEMDDMELLLILSLLPLLVYLID
jgi:hypothetical protein